MKLVCPNCNFSKEIDAAKLPPGIKRATCPKCKQKFDINTDDAMAPPPPPPPPPIPEPPQDEFMQRPSFDDVAETVMLDSVAGMSPPPLPEGRRASTAGPQPLKGGIPWEDRTGGFFGDLFATTKMILLKPTEFFNSMPITGGYKSPLIFCAFWVTIGMVFAFFWQFAMAMVGIGSAGNMAEQLESLPFGLPVLMLIVLAATIVIMPILVSIGMFISAAFIHVFLMIVRGANGGYEATYRVMAYSQAPNVLMIVPFLGQMVSGIWALVLLIIGLPKAHDTGIGRVIIAVIVIPFLLFIGLFVLIGGAVLSAFLASQAGN